MTGFNLYRLYRRAGNGPRTSLRLAAAVLWRDFRKSFVSSFEPLTNAPDPHCRARLDQRAEVERRAR